MLNKFFLNILNEFFFPLISQTKIYGSAGFMVGQGVINVIPNYLSMFQNWKKVVPILIENWLKVTFFNIKYSPQVSCFRGFGTGSPESASLAVR